MIEARRLNHEKHAPKPLSEENERKISDIFGQPFVMPVPLGVDIANSARRLFRTTNRLNKYQDAVHVASAQRWNIPLMHTYDNDDLIHLSGKLECRNGDKLLIIYPDETTDGPLFAKAAD